MAVTKPSFASALAISNVPTVSILAAITGTPLQFFCEFLKVKLRDKSTSARDFSVERLGRIITSLNPSFISFSILILLYLININPDQQYPDSPRAVLHSLKRHSHG